MPYIINHKNHIVTHRYGIICLYKEAFAVYGYLTILNCKITKQIPNCQKYERRLQKKSLDISKNLSTFAKEKCTCLFRLAYCTIKGTDIGCLSRQPFFFVRYHLPYAITSSSVLPTLPL